MRKGLCLCPACGKDLAPKTIHPHTVGCSAWREKYGEPFPQFKFSRQLDLYAPEAIEGRDYVQCRECLTYGWDFRFKRMMDHLTGVHGFDEASYTAKFPGAPVRLASTYERRQATVREHFGVDNVFQAEEAKVKAKQTMLARYGVTSPILNPEIRARTEATNQQRYGAKNVFASKEIQERIRDVNMDRYGAPYPNQNAGVMSRRMLTNLNRYGVPHYVASSGFKPKFKATSIARYGVDHPMKSEQGLSKWVAGCIKAYGVANPLLLPEIHQKTQATSRAHHGGKHHLSDPAVIEARKKRLMELHGVDNVSKIPAVKEKIIAVLLAKEECGAVPEMNGLERSVSKLLPDNVIYTGDWTYWVTWANGRHKNPDFVVLTPEQLVAYKAGVPIKDLRTHLVIEVNGDFWHTKHKGTTRESREREFIEGYASVGVACLVLWESDLKADPEEMADQIRAFLSPAPASSRT